MKTAVLSDIHVDINREYPVAREFARYIKEQGARLAIIAGDVSESQQETLDTLNTIEQLSGARVLFVPGNHDLWGPKGDPDQIGAIYSRYAQDEHCLCGRDVVLGDTVVIMGGGYAGQIIAQCSKLKGAYQVIVVDVLEGKLDLAKSLGADVVVNSREEDPVAKVKALTGGRGADVVVEAAGTAESFNAASAMIRHNGKFVFYSWVTTPVTLNISRWHDDGLEFVNTCLVHHTWQQRYVWVPDTLRPIIQGTVRIKPLITNEFKLADIKAGFDLADKDDAAIKIVFRP